MNSSSISIRKRKTQSDNSSDKKSSDPEEEPTMIACRKSPRLSSKLNSLSNTRINNSESFTDVQPLNKAHDTINSSKRAERSKKSQIEDDQEEKIQPDKLMKKIQNEELSIKENTALLSEPSIKIESTSETNVLKPLEAPLPEV
jgi:hypothetical protein